MWTVNDEENDRLPLSLMMKDADSAALLNFLIVKLAVREAATLFLHVKDEVSALYPDVLIVNDAERTVLEDFLIVKLDEREIEALF